MIYIRTKEPLYQLRYSGSCRMKKGRGHYANSSHFSYNSSSSALESCLFRGSVPHSVLHSYRHPEERECRRSLYLVFQVPRCVFRLFLSSFSCLRLRACSSFCCCQVSFPSEGVSSLASSVASCAVGAYFSVSSSFFSR